MSYDKRYNVLVSARLNKKLIEEKNRHIYRVTKEDLEKLKNVIMKFMKEEINKDYQYMDFIYEIDMEKAKLTREIPGLAMFWTKKITDDSLFAEEVCKYL